MPATTTTDDDARDRLVIISATARSDTYYHTLPCHHVNQMASYDRVPEADAIADGRELCADCSAASQSDPDDLGTVECCPACESRTFTVRSGGGIEDRPTRSDARYFCKDCGHDFDAPATKDGYERAPRKGTAAKLFAADPEDVSR